MILSVGALHGKSPSCHLLRPHLFIQPIIYKSQNNWKIIFCKLIKMVDVRWCMVSKMPVMVGMLLKFGLSRLVVNVSPSFKIFF